MCSQVACGVGHTLLLAETGHVLTCGEGSRGRLGHGDELNVSQPAVVLGIAHSRVRFISAANSLFSLVITGARVRRGWAGRMGEADTAAVHPV